MDYDHGLVGVTVLFIAVTTLVSGPLVGAVDFTTASDEPLFSEPTDQATVEVVSEPEGDVVLEQGDFGNDVFVLRMPPMTIRTPVVRGTPRVTYKIRIRGLRYNRVTSNFLSAEQQGEQFVLEIEEYTFQPDRITESEYTGELSVTVHDSDGSTVVYRTNRTVVVQE